MVMFSKGFLWGGGPYSRYYRGSFYRDWKSIETNGAVFDGPREIWNRTGYFIDENDNMLSIIRSEDPQYEGWYVGGFFCGRTYGWYIPQEGDCLHGNLGQEQDRADFVVTVTEEGEDGVRLVTEGGETYSFRRLEIEEASIIIRIRTEGYGNFKYHGGRELDDDEEYNMISAQINLKERAEYTLGAKAAEGWEFVKWTKNGTPCSEEETITVSFEESADYAAVFGKAS